MTPENTNTSVATTTSETLKVIDAGLKAFEDRKAQLATLAKDYSDLQYTNPEDKATYKSIEEGRKRLKKERNNTENEGKSMRAPLTELSKTIIAKEKELIALIKPDEERLGAEAEKFEEEWKRIEAERIAAEEARIQKRIDGLRQYNQEVDYSMLKSLSDEEYSQVLDTAKAEFEKEEAEKAEAERIRKEQEAAEALRIEKERQAEEQRRKEEDERLRKEREEIERTRAEQERIRQENEAKQAEIERQQKEIAEQQAQIMLDKRRNKLSGIGLTDAFGNDEYAYGEKVLVDKEEIHFLSENDWEALIESAKKRMADHDAEEKQKAEKAAHDKRMQEEKAEQEFKAAEERPLALRPDKEKIATYAVNAFTFPMPECETQAGKHYTYQIQVWIQKLKEQILSDVEAM